MRVVLQRVSSASVTVAGRVTGRIERGFLLLVGWSILSELTRQFDVNVNEAGPPLDFTAEELTGGPATLLDSPGVKPVGASWVGWNLLLPAAALSFALGIGWRRQLLTTWRRGWRQSLAVWLITGLSLAVVIGLIYGGVLWRASLSAG